LRHWGTPGAPLLVALHGWMDVAASFQFVADHLADRWHIVAPDWRGFGLTGATGVDCYEFSDYLGDLDAILRHLSPDAPVPLVGHSMGGNIAMLYAGVRTGRVSAVVNLEGLGLPGTRPEDVPARLATWLDQLVEGARLQDYPSLDAVAERLRKTNPRLTPDRAAFLARHWAREDSGRWVLLADPAHKVLNRVAYRVDEVQACWRAIQAPVLWVEADDSDILRRMTALPDYRTRLEAVPTLRQATVADASHMLHHDQPAAVAQLVAEFLQLNSR
jgi:pimeloyl-ACP methyl ester carboxylesterase